MKKLLSVLLVAIMLLTPLALSVSAESVTDSLIEATPFENKITNELSAHLEEIDDNEYVKIYVWLNDYGEDMLYEALSKRLGTVITATTEESYIANKISLKKQFLKEGLERLAKTGEYNTLSTMGKIEAQSLSTAEFRAQALIPEVMSDTEIKACLESQMSTDDIITLSERTQFLKDYRATRKALNTSVNDTFYKKLNLSKCKNVYLDPLLTRVTMECEKSYIDNLKNMDIVKEVGYYVDFEFTEESVEATSAEPAVITDGYDMFPQNTIDGTTYTGAGINVGVIEVNYCNPNAPHLANKSITNYSPIPEGATTEHGTAVMSVLAGDPLPYNDGTSIKTYQGIAPGVSLYFAGGALTETTTRNHLSWMVQNNCHIINMSLGIHANGYYTYYEQYIDDLILDYRIIIVISVGNIYYFEDDNGNIQTNTNIINPAMSYNSIVVGNVDNTTFSNEKYLMNTESLYEESLTTLANKPDISAFGTKIKMLNNNGIPSNCFPVAVNPTTDHYVSGTSFAAPMVAGTVALMMQANPSLIGKPDTIKALLLGSADENAIYSNDTAGEEDNEIVNSATCEILDPQKAENATSILREKSGAGLLNIPASIRSAISGIYFDCAGGDHTTDRFYINANTTIKFGVVYEKYTDEILSSAYIHQTDIQIIDSNGNIVFKSTDTINNVEMFTCTIKQSGEYRFRIDSSVGNGASSEMNSTIILTCLCSEKNMTTPNCATSTYVTGAHSISCDCGFEVTEVHNWTPTLMIPLSNGAIFIVEIAYLYERGNSTLGEFMCFKESYYFGPASGTNMTLQGQGPVENYSIEYTSTGKIVRYSYSLIIEDDGEYSFVTTRQVTFVYDYYSKTITAY